MSESSEDELEWRPPTEAEKKVLAARRERSDKISKLMGDYLLKGYRMLATTCNSCGTIELQDKQGRLYCVACSEVDCDENSKDNPVLSASAASHQIAEEGERHVNVVPSTSSRISAEVLNRPTTISTVTSRTPQLSIAAPTTTSYTVTPSGDVVHESLAAVLDKMQSATRALATTDNVETSKNLVCLIKECADCILSLKHISPE